MLGLLESSRAQVFLWMMKGYAQAIVFLIISSLVFSSCSKEPETIEEYAEQEVKPNLPKDKKPLKPEKPVEPFMDDFLKEYESYLDRTITSTATPGGGIIVVKNGKVVLMKPFGVRSSEDSNRVDKNTVFRVGSVSKSFAAALCGSLVNQGYLEWSTPVAPYVPVLSFKREDQLTDLQLHHILSQSTGMPRHTYTDMIEYYHDLYDIFSYMPDVDVLYPPGRIHSYQNVLYSISGEMASAVTGMDFSALMHNFIFDPLDMTRSSASYEEITSLNNIAEPHKWKRRGKYLKHKITEKYYQTGPAGGINTTTEDMSHFVKALLGYYPQVLSEDVLDSLYSPRIYTPVRYKYFRNWSDVDKTYYGMGFRVVTTSRDTLVYHGGYVDGFRAGVGLNRKEDLGIAIILNAPTELVSKGIPTFFEMYEKFRPAAEVSSDTLKTLASQ